MLFFTAMTYDHENDLTFGFLNPRLACDGEFRDDAGRRLIRR